MTIGTQIKHHRDRDKAKETNHITVGTINNSEAKPEDAQNHAATGRKDRSGNPQ